MLTNDVCRSLVSRTWYRLGISVNHELCAGDPPPEAISVVEDGSTGTIARFGFSISSPSGSGALDQICSENYMQRVLQMSHQAIAEKVDMIEFTRDFANLLRGQPLHI